ncbi:MAG: hypothetical protein P8J87_10940, partial [Verrucomicrobiales bacterium]|nr:hypothetical protein [Verrucomicrobiales bacterium]
MKTTSRYCLHSGPLTLLYIACTLAGWSRAEVIPIPPENVTASSEIGAPFNRQDDFIVDGSGLDGGQHTAAVQPNMWLSTGTGFGGDDPDPSVTFDLGAVYTITGFHVWNYNESPPNLTGRGVNSVTVEYGSTPELGSTLNEVTSFAEADGTASYTGQEFSGFTPFNARFINFDIHSNHGGDNNFYGLSEVQFQGSLGGIDLSVDGFVTSVVEGDRLGTLTTRSANPDDRFTYTLVPGAGDTDNGKFQIIADELQIGPHNFSTAADGSVFSIRVRSTGSPSGEQTDEV